MFLDSPVNSIEGDTSWTMGASMPQQLSLCLVLCLLFLHAVSSAMLPLADKPKDPDPECTVTNPTTGEFFDLRPLIRKDKEKCPLHL